MIEIREKIKNISMYLFYNLTLKLPYIIPKIFIYKLINHYTYDKKKKVILYKILVKYKKDVTRYLHLGILCNKPKDKLNYYLKGVKYGCSGCLMSLEIFVKKYPNLLDLKDLVKMLHRSKQYELIVDLLDNNNIELPFNILEKLLIEYPNSHNLKKYFNALNLQERCIICIKKFKLSTSCLNSDLREYFFS